MPVRARPLTAQVMLAFAKQHYAGAIHNLHGSLWLGSRSFEGPKRCSTLPQQILCNGTTALIFVQGCQGSERTFCHWSAWNWMSLLQSRRSSNFCNYIKGQKQNLFGVSPGDPFWKPGATLLPICSSPMVSTNHIHYVEGEPPAPTKTACRCTLVTKGRWQHLHTARIHLDNGLQALAAVKLPSPSRP